MSQSKKRSAIESGIVTGIGLSYAVPLNYLFIQHVTMLDPWLRAVVLTALFTVLSFILKYGARRFFEWLDKNFPSVR